MNIRTSPLVQMAAVAKRPTRWWVAWPIGVVIVFAGLIMGDVVGLPLLGRPAADAPVRQFAQFFEFGSIVLLLFLWLRFRERRPFRTIGLEGVKPIQRLLGGLLIGAAMMTAGVLIPWAIGQYEFGASAHGRLGLQALPWLLPLLLVFVLQGSTEELVVRGYMLQTAGLQIPGSVAIIGTSALFSAMHLDFDPIPFANIVLYAVFACFVALGDGSLWRICGIHAGWNYFQGNIYGLPVSGHPDGTSLWNFGPAQGSNALITGGAFGVEASLVGTAILLIATAVAFAQYRRAEARRAADLAAASPDDANVNRDAKPEGQSSAGA